MSIDVDELIEKKLCHEIHNSEIKSFQACRRRWNWHFRESLYPLTTPKPLEFGIAFHVGMETYYNPETWDWDNEVKEGLAIKAFVDSCESQRQKALEQNIFFDPEIEQDYNERVELGKGMLKYYCSKVAPKEDIGWKPVKVEVAFMLPITNPETGEEIIWCKCDLCWEKWHNHERFDEQWLKIVTDKHAQDVVAISGPSNSTILAGVRKDDWQGLPVVYAGRIDALFEDKFGNLFIADWKSAKNVSKDTEFLYLDSQIATYTWAMNKLNLGVRGFIYHEQRKGFPQPPYENKTRRLGCKFSIAKNQEVDYDTYVATISKYDPEGYTDGSYTDMLLYLKQEGPVFYARYQVTKTIEELDSIETNLGLVALDIIDSKIRLYPSPSRFGCKNCAFREPCMEMNSQGDYQYALDTLFEKKEHYYTDSARNRPSTESTRND